MRIESLQNPKIKNLQNLQQKSRLRKTQNLFVVEGLQENRLALEKGFRAKECFICPELFHDLSLPDKTPINQISSGLFQKIAYRGTTGGIIGLYEPQSYDIDQLKKVKTPLIVILESVEKPGNLGAILRTCDGAGVDAVIVCDPLADFYNPNVIRSSVGTVFSVPNFILEKEEVVSFLQENNIEIVATFLNGETKLIYDIDFNQPLALVLGTESSGLSDFWKGNANHFAKIPMNGLVDSLNVSNAAAICIYEALRQRNYAKTS